MELSNEKGKTAGFGDAAFAAAGAGPEAVRGLRVSGSRGGATVRWQPATGAGEVVLRRELVGGTSEQRAKSGKAISGGSGPAAGGRKGRGGRAGQAKPAKGESEDKPGVVWLSTVPEADPLAPPTVDPTQAVGMKNAANGVLDDGAAVGGTYRYEAERRETVQLGGPTGEHTLVLRSELSAPVEVTLEAIYPPPAPTELVGTVFPLPGDDTKGEAGGLAVDLIWTPADDPGTVGYKVWREANGVQTVLTKDLLKTPAFHDVLPTGLAGQLTYGVVAVDARGMESVAVVTTVAVER